METCPHCGSRYVRTDDEGNKVYQCLTIDYGAGQQVSKVCLTITKECLEGQLATLLAANAALTAEVERLTDRCEGFKRRIGEVHGALIHRSNTGRFHISRDDIQAWITMLEAAMLFERLKPLTANDRWSKLRMAVVHMRDDGTNNKDELITFDFVLAAMSRIECEE